MALCWMAATARAEIESDLVRQGMAAYEELDYQKSVDLLDRARAETLTREEKVATWKTLAFAHAALDQTAEAREAFEQLLTVDKTFELDRTISPRVRTIFDQARESWQARQPRTDANAGRPAVLKLDTDPVRPVAGTPVTVAVSESPPRAEHFEVMYRTPDPHAAPGSKTSWSRVEGRPVGDGGYAALIPGLAVAVPTLEYYAQARDTAGVIVGVNGSEGEPLSLEVLAPPPRPVYKRPWFWGVVVGAVAVVGAGTATAIALTSRPGPTTPATVVIYPQ